MEVAESIIPMSHIISYTFVSKTPETANLIFNIPYILQNNTLKEWKFKKKNTEDIEFVTD